MVKKLIGKSNETTVGGVGGLIACIGLLLHQHFDGDPATVVQWYLLIPALSLAYVAWRSRDNNKKSEDVGLGAQPPKSSGVGSTGMGLAFAPFLLLPLLSMGCAPGSLNVQRSGLRASGDLSITLFLDNNPSSKADAKAQASKAMAFLETGGIANLPVTEVSGKLTAIIPLKYKDWVTQALAIAVIRANEATVDVSKIGEANLARLRAFVRGVVQGADLFTTPPVETAEPEGGNTNTDANATTRSYPLLCFHLRARISGMRVRFGRAWQSARQC